MSDIKKEYYLEETDKIKEFHQSRRMFCIYDDQLRIADDNVPYSHATWFQNENWMTKEKDGLMNEIVRGIVDSKGDIYFYVGYNFEINDIIELIFFNHLAELVKRLNLDTNAKIFGGLIKSEPGKIWTPIKSYGKIADKIK
ncbi:MAG: hypothetical protein UR60_C0001G0022 [Candidatus Moranbacteria bacterium GW2011_GWF2_34_56]|nr:MAG: hypothetical protein UR51_C0002G0017 [Candidatus Moranbacteria bacterium GW2011_GWF1_34_10]KKP65415.1 MAG: hypothetical protein UR60_C0001G0022 [Candidatus Moranbacteria bacterium GW2011_GWF2_34_56]HBI16623.1 hypothetical protein [Candidatus Moranbacteria bacterium]